MYEKQKTVLNKHTFIPQVFYPNANKHTFTLYVKYRVQEL